MCKSVGCKCKIVYQSNVRNMKTANVSNSPPSQLAPLILYSSSDYCNIKMVRERFYLDDRAAQI